MNEIPDITNELGRHWEQPSKAKILVDDKHALMCQDDFESLPEYSTTVPSGVYEGKMWRRHDGIFIKDKAGCLPKPEDCPWLLCWYGPSSDPNRCSINYRTILLC